MCVVFSKYFGPVVTMMYRMVKNMLYFIVLILVVLVSFGVCNQSIKYPNEDWDWRQAPVFSYGKTG